MSAYCCDKLCSDMCCLWLRTALGTHPKYVVHDNCDCHVCTAWRDVHDPAKLAELGAMALRARGLRTAVAPLLAGNLVELIPIPNEIMMDARQGVVLLMPGPFERTLTMPEFCALLARIMATPADESSREQCEKLIRGET